MTDPPPAEAAPELLTRVATTRALQEQIAAVHDQFQRDLLDRFLNDLESTNRRKIFDQVRKELAGDFSSVRRIERVELAADDLPQ